MRRKIFLLTFVVLLIYLNCLLNPFIWDDIYLIITNPYIKNFKNFPHYFTTDIFREGSSNFYRPLQTIFYAIIYHIFGLKVLPYHLLNILLHLGNTLLFFLILEKIYGEKISFFVSLLFAVHPINSEAITYISGTADPLFLFFGLLSIFLFSREKYFISYICFILSLLSKESGLIIPLFLILYEWALENSFKKNIKKYLPIFSIVIIYSTLRLTILRFPTIESTVFLFRFFTSFKSFLLYLYLLIFPKTLSMEREIPYIKTPLNLWFISGFLLFCGSIFLLWHFRKNKKIIFPGVWFLTGFISISNIFIPLNSNFSEHWMYSGCIGFFIYFVLIFNKFIKNNKKFYIFISILCVLYGTRTVIRNFDWKDPEKFYKKSIETVQKKTRLYQNLGDFYLHNGEYEKALESFKKAEAFSENKPLITLGIARALMGLGKVEEAKKYYNEVLAKYPTHPQAFFDLALIYLEERDFVQVEKLLALCIKHNPAFQPAYRQLGKLYYQTGDYERSEKYLKNAIQIEPDDDLSHNQLGIVYYKSNKIPEAIKEFTVACQLKPFEISYILNLAFLYSNTSNFDSAIYYYKKALKISPQNPEILNDLAICYALKGEKDKAAEIWEEIIKKYPDFELAKQNIKLIKNK